MQKDCQTHQRSRHYGKKCMLHWRPTPNTITPISPAGSSRSATVMFYWCHSTPALLYFMTDFGLLLVWTDISVNRPVCRSCRWSVFFSLVTQICQAAPPSARSALHRTEVPGASVLLQAHRRHTYRHFPHGDAGSATSNHMTQVLLRVNIPQRTLNPIITKRSSYFVPSTMWKTNKHKRFVLVFSKKETLLK